MQRRTWFERQFELDLPPESLPDVIERLRGTPIRLEERVSRVPDEFRAQRVDGG